MNKHVKSTLVKILAALALAFACVAVANAFLPILQLLKLFKLQESFQKLKKLLRDGSQCANQVVATLLETVLCYGKYQLNIGYLHGNLSPKNQERVLIITFTVVTVHGLTRQEIVVSSQLVLKLNSFTSQKLRKPA